MDVAGMDHLQQQHQHHHHLHHHHHLAHVPSDMHQQHHLVLQQQQQQQQQQHDQQVSGVLPEAEALPHHLGHQTAGLVDGPVLHAVMQQHDQLQHAAAELHQQAAAALHNVPDGLQAAVWNATMQQHGSHQAALAAAGSDDGFGPDTGTMQFGETYEDGSLSDGKRTTKKKSKGGRIASEISKEELSACFNMPSEDAAKRLGVGLTVLKRICRKFGVPRWPYRKLKSLDRLIQNVETGTAPGETYKHLMKSADEIRERQKEMCTGNMLDLDDSTKKLQQAYSKFNHKLRKATDKGESDEDAGGTDEAGMPKPTKATVEQKRREKASKREAAEASGLTSAQAHAMQQHGAMHMQALLVGEGGAPGTDPNLLAYHAAMMGGAPFSHIGPMQPIMMVEPSYRAMGLQPGAHHRKEGEGGDGTGKDEEGKESGMPAGDASAATMEMMAHNQQVMAAWWGGAGMPREAIGDPAAYANWVKAARGTYGGGYPDPWAGMAAAQQHGVSEEVMQQQQAAAAAAYAAQYSAHQSGASGVPFQYSAPRGYAGYPAYFQGPGGYGYPGGYEYPSRMQQQQQHPHHPQPQQQQPQQAAAASETSNGAGGTGGDGGDSDANKRRRLSPSLPDNGGGGTAVAAAAAADAMAAASHAESYYSAYPYYRPAWQWPTAAGTPMPPESGMMMMMSVDHMAGSMKPEEPDVVAVKGAVGVQALEDDSQQQQAHHHHHQQDHDAGPGPGDCEDLGGCDQEDQATESVAHALLNMANVPPNGDHGGMAGGTGGLDDHGAWAGQELHHMPMNSMAVMVGGGQGAARGKRSAR